MFKAGKTYKTRDDRDARVLATGLINCDGKSILITAKNSFDNSVDEDYWLYADGKYSKQSIDEVDLIPPMVTVFVNFYFNGHAHYHDDKKEAIRAAECCNDSCLHVAIPVEIPDA